MTQLNCVFPLVTETLSTAVIKQHVCATETKLIHQKDLGVGGKRVI